MIAQSVVVVHIQAVFVGRPEPLAHLQIKNLESQLLGLADLLFSSGDSDVKTTHGWILFSHIPPAFIKSGAWRI